MMQVQIIPKGTDTYVYKCPLEGEKCDGHKHCHAYESPVKLVSNLPVVLMCPVLKNAKITVLVGAHPIRVQAK